MKKHSKATLSFFLKFFLTALLLFFVIKNTKFEIFLDQIKSIQGPYLLLAMVIVVVNRVLMTLRWNILLSARRIYVDFNRLLKSMFISQFFGSLLPASSISADLIRGVDISREYGSKTSVASTLLLDRLVGLFSMLIVALIGSALLTYYYQDTLLIKLLGAANLALIISVAAFLGLIRRYANRLDGKPGRKVNKLLMRSISFFTDINSMVAKKTISYIFFISISVQLLRCLIVYYLYLSMKIDIDLVHSITFVPILFVALTLPVSIGGFGIREFGLTYLFGYIQIQREASIIVGILLYFIQIVIAAPYVLIWLVKRK